MDFVALIGFGVASMAAAATGAVFQPGDWYRNLDKPNWTPPDWMFPVVWTALYILIVWSAWRVSVSGHPLTAPALAIFSAQITLNALWSPIFFGLRRMGAAMLVLSFLWLSVAAMLAFFWMVEPVAGAMIIPYLIWVSVAGALNFSVWRRNRPGRAAFGI
jgi:translocator protein